MRSSRVAESIAKPRNVFLQTNDCAPTPPKSTPTTTFGLDVEHTSKFCALSSLIACPQGWLTRLPRSGSETYPDQAEMRRMEAYLNVPFFYPQPGQPVRLGPSTNENDWV